ncbi:MAG: shikimate dehydrogenase [Candidatus Omnitrophica bacterium]|nr:shikimate dehydrogenase [Candidatus Omnitrophota bacterium]
MKTPPLYGLLGYPVKHSLSPLMHNAAFRHLKRRAHYRLFEVPPDRLKDFFRSFSQKNIRGFNVTVPYKEEVLRYLDGYCAEAVKSIGAANTVVIDPRGRRCGYNTDCLGFVRHLKELKLKPRKVALIGAGGAAKAVGFVLGKLGVQEVDIYDIDRFKSLGLFKRFYPLFPNTRFTAVSSIAELSVQKKDLLINASPVGMKPDDPMIVDPAVLHPGLFVYEVIYNPAKTRLLMAAEEKGCRVANGLLMLLYQGAEALDLWIKPKKAPVEIMRKALTKGAKKI